MIPIPSFVRPMGEQIRFNLELPPIFVQALAKVEAFSKKIAGNICWHVTARFAPTSPGANSVTAVGARSKEVTPAALLSTDESRTEWAKVVHAHVARWAFSVGCS